MNMFAVGFESCKLNTNRGVTESAVQTDGVRTEGMTFRTNRSVSVHVAINYIIVLASFPGIFLIMARERSQWLHIY